MRRTARPAIALTGAVLIVAGCTSTPEPAAKDDATTSTVTPASSATPSDDGGGVGGDLSADEAQRLTDAAIGELSSSRSVDAGLIREADEDGGVTVTITLSTVWMPGQNAWMGIGRYRYSMRPHQVVRSQVLSVDGRAYLRDRERPADSIAWEAGKGLGVLGVLGVPGLSTENGWPFAAPLEAMTATSAEVKSSTTTVLGEVPNQVALHAFSMAKEIEDSAFDDELYPDSALVILTIEDGYPSRLAILGKNLGMPAHGLSPEIMERLAASSIVYRYAEGTRTQPLRRPPPRLVEPAHLPLPED